MAASATVPASTGGAAAAPATGQPITIDVIKDLDNLSDLKSLISAQGKAIFTLAGQLAQYAGQPVSTAAAAGLTVLDLDLQASLPTWKAGVASFSLKPEAKCTIAIGNQGESLPVALKLDSTDTTDVQLTANPVKTYINIDLDFHISGNASGSGTTGFGLTISGKASGSANTSVSFCQAVDSTTETVAALKQALSQVVFPTAPNSIGRMAAGSSSKMSFHGTLNAKVDASYGLGDYKLSAPSAALVQQSVGKAWQNLTLPSAEVKMGASASVKYAHTDHFGIVATKQDDNTAFVYLVRSSSDEFDETVGFTAGVTTNGVSLSLDSTKVQQTVQSITGSAALASSVANAVAQPVNNLETAATAKLNAWIADANGNVGLSIAGSQQTSRLGLFNYQVDLTQASAVAASWGALLSSSLASLQAVSGFTLLPGSGVSARLKKSTTLQFNFFNLYKYTNQSDFFNNCTSELGSDGTIQITFDIGIEGTVTSNNATDKIRLYFSGTSTEDTDGDVSKAEIDLNVEMSEKGDRAGAVTMTKILQALNLPSLGGAITAMNLYAQSNPGTLGLTAVLKPSAYSRLAYSPYSGNKPPVDQTLDARNWDAIRDATVRVISDLDFLSAWTYADWSLFDSYCLSGSPGSAPDRRKPMPSNAVPGSFFAKDPARQLYISSFMVASAGGMNFFEDLATLASDLNSAVTDDQLKAVQQHLVAIVKSDLNIDYSRPIAAAILSQASYSGVQTTVTTAQASDKSTFTTTLTVS
jgi:hypothetical protein